MTARNHLFLCLHTTFAKVVYSDVGLLIHYDNLGHFYPAFLKEDLSFETDILVTRNLRFLIWLNSQPCLINSFFCSGNVYIFRLLGNILYAIILKIIRFWLLWIFFLLYKNLRFSYKNFFIVLIKNKICFIKKNFFYSC